MMEKWGIEDALFSLKCLIAAILSLYIALRIGLTHPYWAVTTSYIVAQPLSGTVVSKAVFRVMGTVLGAAAAVVLVPNLVNSPELLTLGLGLWLGLCMYISLQDRTPRSYVFMLAGYTASIIGFPSVTDPGSIFDVAVLRVQEITLGIACGSLVHAIVLPQSVTAVLLARIETVMADVEEGVRDALGEKGDEALRRDRRRIALDIAELHQLSTHLPFDTARFLPRVRTVHALQDQLSQILPVASAAEDRLAQLHQLGPLPPGIEELIEDIRIWLGTAPTDVVARAETVAGLVARTRALEPDPTGPLQWRDALTLSLLARLADLVEAHRAIRDLRDQIRSPSTRPVSPVVEQSLAHVSRRSFHRDRAVALRGALGTTATIVLGGAFWIGTGWPAGAGATLIAGVSCAMFGAVDDPRPLIMQFFWGSLLGVIVAMIYAFAILPRVTDFVTLAVVISPPLLLMGSQLGRGPWRLIALGVLLGFVNVVGLDERYDTDFATFTNNAIAQLMGTFFAVVTVGLFQAIGKEQSAGRIITAGWRDLARRSNRPGRPDAAAWVSRMLDRIGLLAPRLAAIGEDPGRPMLDALQDLRVGLTVGMLRDLREDTGPARGALITPVLQGVSGHYAAMRVDKIPPGDPELLRGIDRALNTFSYDEDHAIRRRAVVALTGLRRNLFPLSDPFVAGSFTVEAA